MRTIRVHVAQALAVGADVNLPEDTAHHVFTVLRLQLGDALNVFNADDGEFSATLVGAQGKTATVRCNAALARMPEPQLQVTLVQALATGDRVDSAIQKATELGVAAVTLFRGARSQGKLTGARAAKKLAHWQRVATAAAEQCGRCTVPVVRLTDKGLPPAGDILSLLLHPEADQTITTLPAVDQLQVAVGPEGGFSDEELHQAEAQGWQRLRCGPRVLRTETAGPAVLAALQALHGDWR
ncbi:16S rRNA (uracil(1498)-N(3))-methyltransferase [bacterium]|nr:16S rRNA (uracil(1498)-N(3))-methyltransferase [bacterium]